MARNEPRYEPRIEVRLVYELYLVTSLVTRLVSPPVCQHQGLARRSAGKRHTATTNEVSDCTKIVGEILLEGLIGRSINVRKVEHEQVDASTGGTSICPIGPPCGLPLSAIVLAAAESLLVE